MNCPHTVKCLRNSSWIQVEFGMICPSAPLKTKNGTWKCKHWDAHCLSQVATRMTLFTLSLISLIPNVTFICHHEPAFWRGGASQYKLSTSTYCWWFRNPAFTSWGWWFIHVYSIIYTFLYISGGWEWDFWTMPQKERMAVDFFFTRRYGAEIINISWQTGGNRNCLGGFSPIGTTWLAVTTYTWNPKMSNEKRAIWLVG